MKKTRVDGVEVSYSGDWIDVFESRQHFSWYWRQAKMVYDFCQKEESLLELGKGTGCLSDILRGKGWNIRTLDIDEDKKPDFCCDAYSFDYLSVSPDVLLAFEIFEHLPFETFVKVISKISVSGVRKIIFSVPWCERQLFGLSLKFPYFTRWDFYVPLNGRKILEPNHFWELSTRDQGPLKKLNSLKEIFSNNGFSLSEVAKEGRIQFFCAVKGTDGRV